MITKKRSISLVECSPVVSAHNVCGAMHDITSLTPSQGQIFRTGGKDQIDFVGKRPCTGVLRQHPGQVYQAVVNDGRRIVIRRRLSLVVDQFHDVFVHTIIKAQLEMKYTATIIAAATARHDGTRASRIRGLTGIGRLDLRFQNRLEFGEELIRHRPGARRPVPACLPRSRLPNTPAAYLREQWIAERRRSPCPILRPHPNHRTSVCRNWAD